MMLSIALSAEKEAKLRERAAAVGKEIAEYVVDVLDEDLALAEPPPSRDLDSPQRIRHWEKELDAWAASHPRLTSIADDSRDSIYAGQGE